MRWEWRRNNVSCWYKYTCGNVEWSISVKQPLPQARGEHDLITSQIRQLFRDATAPSLPVLDWCF
jgi:hypothetical protein